MLPRPKDHEILKNAVISNLLLLLRGHMFCSDLILSSLSPYPEHSACSSWICAFISAVVNELFSSFSSEGKKMNFLSNTTVQTTRLFPAAHVERTPVSSCLQLCETVCTSALSSATRASIFLRSASLTSAN